MIQAGTIRVWVESYWANTTGQRDGFRKIQAEVTISVTNKKHTEHC